MRVPRGILADIRLPSVAAPLALVLALALTSCGDEDAPPTGSHGATEAGELHVHSTPEQKIESDAGTSEHELVIDRPGVVEVESHEPDVVLLQLDVR